MAARKTVPPAEPATPRLRARKAANPELIALNELLKLMIFAHRAETGLCPDAIEEPYRDLKLGRPPARYYDAYTFHVPVTGVAVYQVEAPTEEAARAMLHAQIATDGHPRVGRSVGISLSRVTEDTGPVYDLSGIPNPADAAAETVINSTNPAVVARKAEIRETVEKYVAGRRARRNQVNPYLRRMGIEEIPVESEYVIDIPVGGNLAVRYRVSATSEENARTRVAEIIERDGGRLRTSGLVYVDEAAPVVAADLVSQAVIAGVFPT